MATPPARTYALLVASNDGGPGQARLRYAEADAHRMAEVLTTLGGYDPSRVQRLLKPSADELRAALNRLEAQLAADAVAGEQSLVFLYYSGHARAEALSLGAETMALAELRERITALPATLSIVVLDACQSGAFSRVKGAAPTSDFSFNSVQRLNTEGIAVMASSSALELSQESDELESSYFTHHLLVAMRGGGDVNRDGRVTLSEAYQYAYNHTLAQTAATAVGEQHVTLETDFRGKGDVPLTYPARARSRLRLGPELAGKLILQQVPSSSVLAEVQKVKGSAVELALPHGEYTATLRRDAATYRCELRIADGQTSTLQIGRGCALVDDGAARAKGAPGGGDQRADGDELFVFEALFGLGTRNDQDAYGDRLEAFGFARTNDAIGRYSLALGIRPHGNLLVGASFANLDAARYARKNRDVTQDFIWESYAVGPFVQGDLAFGHHRLITLFARLGFGLAYGITTFDAIASDAPFADDNHSFEDTTTSTRAVEESFAGYYVAPSLGVALSAHDNFGFMVEARYVHAPALDNLSGETHDVGGFAYLLGLRVRTWQ